MPIIEEPGRKPHHSCALGWTTRKVDPENTMMPEGVTETRIPPRDRDHPVGRIWQCDICGKTWVVQPRFAGAPGLVTFAAEGRLARWRRFRRTKRP
jgi:hypothetical protein